MRLPCRTVRGVDPRRRGGRGRPGRTPDPLAARLAEDEATLDLLRSVPRETAPLQPRPVVPLRWSPSRPTVLTSRAPAPKAAPTWTSVLEEPAHGIPGPLSGLEVGVKDLLAVRGHATTAGTRAHRSPVATADAPAVAALRAAGARIAGTTNLHALAYGATGRSSDWGVPVNPAVAGVIPGGSSSGSAVAVAEGSADLTLGTDTGGSIRIPAAMCGVVGLKPTYDVVSRLGCHPLSPTMDHVGPLARDVATVAAAFAVLTGERESGLGELAAGPIVGGVLGGHFAVLTPEVRAAFDAALDALDRGGVELHPMEPVLAAHCPGAQLGVQSPEALRSNLTTLRERGAELPEDVRVRLEAGFARTPEQHRAGLELARRWRAEVDALLVGCHVLLSPTTTLATPALTRTTVEASGVIGRRGGDRELLHVAAHVERLLRY